MSTQIARKPYPTDLSNEAWEWIAPFLAQSSGPGRPRTVDIREIANAIFYLDFCKFARRGARVYDHRH
jgi:transposase